MNFSSVFSLFLHLGGDLTNMTSESKSSEFIVGFPMNRANDIAEIALFVTTIEVNPVPFVVETPLGHVFTGNVQHASHASLSLLFQSTGVWSQS